MHFNTIFDICLDVAILLLHTLSAAVQLASTFSCTLLSAFIHSDARMLKIQQYKRKTHGFRTFSCFGPHIWNSLPQDLRHCSTLSVSYTHLTLPTNIGTVSMTAVGKFLRLGRGGTHVGFSERIDTILIDTHCFRTFSCFGPHIWNSLPQDLRHCSTLSSFKAKLRTFLLIDGKFWKLVPCVCGQTA